MKFILKNPLTEYLIFLINLVRNKIKFKNYYQGYYASVNNSIIDEWVCIYDKASINSCRIGSFTYISSNTRISRTEIGRFCSIGPDCKIGWGLHPTGSFVSTHPAFYSLSKQAGITFADKNYFNETNSIKIGNDVWIGANVVIVDGVTIGDGAIIAAGAIVTQDVPNYAIFGGVPAKLIRYRFDENTIDFLLTSKWWVNDHEWFKNNYKRFLDIELFKKS